MASCPRPTSSLTPTVGEAKARRTEARETSGSLGACAQRSWRGLSRGKDMLVRCYQGTPTSKSLGGKGGVLENNAYPWAQAKTHWTKVEGSKNMLNGLIKWGWGPLMGDVREWWPMALLLRNQEKKKEKEPQQQRKETEGGKGSSEKPSSAGARYSALSGLLATGLGQKASLRLSLSRVWPIIATSCVVFQRFNEMSVKQPPCRGYSINSGYTQSDYDEKPFKLERK